MPATRNAKFTFILFSFVLFQKKVFLRKKIKRLMAWAWVVFLGSVKYVMLYRLTVSVCTVQTQASDRLSMTCY